MMRTFEVLYSAPDLARPVTMLVDAWSEEQAEQVFARDADTCEWIVAVSELYPSGVTLEETVTRVLDDAGVMEVGS